MNYVIYALLLFILLLPACGSTYDHQAWKVKQITRLTEEIKIHEVHQDNITKAMSKAGLALSKAETPEEQAALFVHIKHLTNRRTNVVYNITWKKDRIRRLHQGRENEIQG